MLHLSPQQHNRAASFVHCSALLVNIQDLKVNIQDTTGTICCAVVGSQCTGNRQSDNAQPMRSQRSQHAVNTQPMQSHSQSVHTQCSVLSLPLVTWHEREPSPRSVAQVKARCLKSLPAPDQSAGHIHRCSSIYSQCSQCTGNTQSIYSQ